MENFEDTEPIEEAAEEQEQLVVTEEIRSYIYETAKWTKFLSIIGFVFAVFMALAAFSATAIMENVVATAPGNPMAQLGATFLTVYFLCISLMMFYPSFLMFKFSNAANTGVLYADQENFTIAMKKLKSLFKFWGVLTIVILAMYVLALLLTLVAKTGGA
ncbi:hypothetical protein FBD94_05945 [Pedobacter hiemivivus]|jgi:hypothetical protein|uniref:DUF5362 domain-containing protein n=1 Tax=Pedobacter hiemivivus TaxID=2530454 RepID=A0A4U1GHZ1_9SPHI|nr:hypothetical protein [Pedobacter hiemivivus]TCC99270.1 hypothetical protein EZ444_00900 [Pedobacter hiemivivus]TKC63885.1 hypothetical protein FBD94_05945 [Pedobacter hiemivivus]